MADSHGPVVDADEHHRIRAAVDQLRDLLVPGETLEAIATQRRLFALVHRRKIVGSTSGRLVVMHRGVFGGFRLQDVRWQDLKDVRISFDLFGATLEVDFLRSTDVVSSTQSVQDLSVNGLRKAEAQAIYKSCQMQEQAWREKRRIRDLEEFRAKSGGINIGSTPGIPSPTDAPVGIEDPAARLQRAKEMLEKGLLTDSEYEAIKAKVVSSL